MHKVYENDDLMMYFKKRYCHCCGNVLKRKRTERIVKKSDPDHGTYCTIGTNYKPYGDVLVIGKEYYCSLCNKAFSCDEQARIIEAQKYYRRKMVSTNEISFVEKNQEVLALTKINKFKWLLLIPILGGLICLYYIFNGKLNKKTNSKDGIKVLLFSTIVFIGVAVVVKIVLNLFEKSVFINNYSILIMLLLAALSYNIPIFCYINSKFKTKAVKTV